MSNKLKIHFVVPAIDKTGGVAVVMQHAGQLQKMGHSVRIYYPLLPYRVYFGGKPRWKKSLSRMKFFFTSLLDIRRIACLFPDGPELAAVPLLKGFFIRDADIIIATAWPTAYDVAKLPASKGKKFYFVQHYETWHGHVAAVDASYKLPLNLLVIAPWLTDLMHVKFGRRVTAEIHNGIDLSFFRPPRNKTSEYRSILMMYHVLEVKGITDGLEVLRRVHHSHPDVRIRMFGMYPFKNKDPFIEYFMDPPPEKLLELFQTSHIFLSPSLSEGWGLPSMEAMACGCAVVATNVGCIPILKNGKNLLSSPPSDPEALFRHVESLLNHSDEMQEMARKGRETVLDFSWEKCSKHLERVLLSEKVI